MNQNNQSDENGPPIGESVYMHLRTMQIFYCEVRGLAPAQNSIGFDNFDEILPAPYGKSVNHMISAGELTEVELTDLEEKPDPHASMTPTPEEQIEFLKAKGLTVGMMKTSDKEEPYLACVIQPGSELCYMRVVNRLVDAQIMRDSALLDLVEYRRVMRELLEAGASATSGRRKAACAAAEKLLAKEEPK